MAEQIPTEIQSSAPRAEASPFVIEFFMVQCPGFRCMAYRDEAGSWRSAFSHQELPEDVYILE